MRIVTRTIHVAAPGFEPIGADGKTNPALAPLIREMRRDVNRLQALEQKRARRRARKAQQLRLRFRPRPRTPRLRGTTVHIERPTGPPIDAEACAGLDPPTPPLHLGVILPGVLAEIQRRMRRRRSA